jgi:hypothetical protein
VASERTVSVRQLALISAADADLRTTHELTAQVWGMLGSQVG